MADGHDQELQAVEFGSGAAFEAWLDAGHGTSAGVWLKIAKKDSGVVTVTYREALDAALCHGWIDGQKRALDDRYWLQRFTPRAPRSRWSKVNCARAAELVAAGRMRPAGLAEMERARADGRWDAAYDSPRTATVPDDLRRALDADPAADAFFATLDGRNRYAVLHRIEAAKRPETRARRISDFVDMLREHRRIHP